MTENSKQNLTTVVAIVIALVAVVYALMMHMNKPKMPETTIKAYNAGENNPVVLRIDGQDVTRAELLDNFNRSGSRVPEGVSMDRLFPMMQEQYLVGALITNAAQKEGVGVSHPDVLAKAKPALEQAIRAVYLEKVGDEGVSDKDIEKVYQDMVVNAPDLMERRARHILIKDEKKANAILIKAQKTSDFAKLAKENSEGPSAEQGGDLGYFVQAEMVPEFAKAAFEMKIGSVSDKIVKTQFGYHIIKVEDERMRERPTLDQVRNSIKQQLAQKAVSEKLQTLREKANIEAFDAQGNALKAAEEAPNVEESKSEEKAPKAKKE